MVLRAKTAKSWLGRLKTYSTILFSKFWFMKLLLMKLMTWCQIFENWHRGTFGLLTDFQGTHLWNLSKLLFRSYQLYFSSMPIIFLKREIWQSCLDLRSSAPSISSVFGIELSLPEESIFPWFVWNPLDIVCFFHTWQLI